MKQNEPIKFQEVNESYTMLEAKRVAEGISKYVDAVRLLAEIDIKE